LKAEAAFPLMETAPSSDVHWMRRALELARRAQDMGEVPVGAVLVKDGTLIAEGWNQPIAARDPSAHAEMLALRAGGQALQNYRLVETTLYVTLEPCVMCMGAIVHARVRRLVYGADDPLRGCAGSVLQLAEAPFLNHRLDVCGGLLAAECASLLKGFFQSRR
jgi:tRNA(adenine34) deaminase